MKTSSKRASSANARWLSGLATVVAVGVMSLSIQAEQKSDKANLRVAEAFIDAFYSFDSAKLQAALSSAKDSVPFISYYQVWAKGGNYKIVNRMPCRVKEPMLVYCSITVKDDLMGALGVDFNVTDTFHISFSDGKIISVRTSSNDLPVFSDALEWVKKNLPDLIEKPCRGFFDGGPTPGDCVRAMVEGYGRFSVSADFPEKYKK